MLAFGLLNFLNELRLFGVAEELGVHVVLRDPVHALESVMDLFQALKLVPMLADPFDKPLSSLHLAHLSLLFISLHCQFFQ